MSINNTNPADYTTTNDYTDKGLLDAQGKTRVVYTILNKHAANEIGVESFRYKRLSKAARKTHKK